MYACIYVRMVKIFVAHQDGRLFFGVYNVHVIKIIAASHMNISMILKPGYKVACSHLAQISGNLHRVFFLFCFAAIDHITVDNNQVIWV